MKVVVPFVIALNKVVGMAAPDGFSKYGVGVGVIEDKDVAHIAVGGDRESTWEVGANETLKVLPRKRVGAYFVVAVTMVSWGGEWDVMGRGESSHCVKRMPWRVRFIFPMTVGTDFVRCLRIRLLVRLSQVAKKPALMALQNVGIAG